MAISHSHIASVQRSKGQSAVASAAYRAGLRLKDLDTGETFDYRKKGKEEVWVAEIVVPYGQPMIERHQDLWMMAERAEKRKDAQVARTLEIALPRELTEEQQTHLTRAYCQAVADLLGVAGDFAIHRDEDGRNPHFHFGFTTRRYRDGALQEKTRELDVKKTSSDLVVKMREMWAEAANEWLAVGGHEARVDMRSYADQGIDLEAGEHRGPAGLKAGAERAAARDLEADLERAEREVRQARANGHKQPQKHGKGFGVARHQGEEETSGQGLNGLKKGQEAVQAPRRPPGPRFSL